MPDPAQLTLLACQIAIPPMVTRAERDAHLARMAEKVQARLRTAESPVDLVVLPELSSLDYSRETFENLTQLAKPLDGPSFQTWRAVATACKAHILFSFARQGEDRPCICAAVVGPDGALVGQYDKLHLAQYGASMEKEYFKRGGHLFVFDVKGFRLAPIICYDIRIPELSRALAVDHGVDVILHCGAYCRDESFHTWHPFVITRAMENQLYLLSLNRAGALYGNSLLCPPWQDENTPATRFSETGEDLRVLTLDRDTLRQTRRDYTFLKDRLADYRLPQAGSPVGRAAQD